jgi:hypothetical protein
MTKEQFLEIIKKPEIPMEIWFEYYKERGGLADPETFTKVFTTALWNQWNLRRPDGSVVQVSFKTALEGFYEYYAKKFNHEYTRPQAEGGSGRIFTF